MINSIYGTVSAYKALFFLENKMTLRERLQKYIKDLREDWMVSIVEGATNQARANELEKLLQEDEKENG